MRPSEVLDLLEDRPFKPFRMHMSDGSIVGVVDPGMIIVGQSSVVVPSSLGRDEEGRRLAKHWRTLSIGHIVQFTEVEEPLTGKRQKKK